jgi:hypothetical protein
MPVKLNSTGGGSVTVTAVNTASDYTLTAPAKTGNIITSADTGTVTSTMLASNAITSALLPAGSVLQVVNSAVTAYTTGTTILPWDDTIPQNTEGTEFITAAITPKSTTSKLLIQFSGSCSTSAAAWISAALFQDSTAGALAATSTYMATSAGGAQIVLNYYMTSGTTSSTTFKIRVGPAVAATVSINGAAGVGRYFGGVSSTTLVITEIAA